MKKLCSVLLVLAGSVNAADLSSQLVQCSKENDSLKRLMCFDQLALKTSSISATKTEVAMPNSVKPDDVKPTTHKAEVAKLVEVNAIDDAKNEVKATITPEPITKVTTAPSQHAEDIFGKESIKKMDAVDEVNFTIKTASLSLRKKWRFTFENGQQWEQKDSDKFAKFKSGDQVLIKRGLMNAFYLKKSDANRTIRVKRIK